MFQRPKKFRPAVRPVAPRLVSSPRYAREKARLEKIIRDGTRQQKWSWLGFLWSVLDGSLLWSVLFGADIGRNKRSRRERKDATREPAAYGTT